MNSQGVGGNRRVFEFDTKVDRNSPHTHMNDNYVCWKFSWGLQKLSPSYFFRSLILFSSSLLFLTFRSVLTYIIFAPFAFCSPQSIVCTAFKYFVTQFEAKLLSCGEWWWFVRFVSLCSSCFHSLFHLQKLHHFVFNTFSLLKVFASFVNYCACPVKRIVNFAP